MERDSEGQELFRCIRPSETEDNMPSLGPNRKPAEWPEGTDSYVFGAGSIKE